MPECRARCAATTPICWQSSPRTRTPTSCSTRSSASPGCPQPWPRSEHGKVLALANKESLIAGGPVVAAAREQGKGELVPVDSEHSALYQALRSGTHDEVRRLIVTASGGPFRGRTREELALVTVADALEAPDVGHGRQDHDRLVDAHEQGARGDRGARAVRGRLRPDRRRRAPPVGGARHGRVHRRRHGRAAVDARHAPSDRARTGRPRPSRRAVRRHRLDDPVRSSPSRPPTPRRSRACAWPTKPGGRAVGHPRC